MKRLISVLDRILLPWVPMAYFAVCLIALAAAKSVSNRWLFLGMILSAVLMAALYWGIYGTLTLAMRKFELPERQLKTLVRAIEIAEVFVVVSTAVIAIASVSSVPTAGFSLPVALLGLAGAVRFDARYVTQSRI